jgi:hypothetical protein
MRILALLACVVLSTMLSTNAFAECSTTSTGRTVCNNGQQAGGYNPNTGNAWKSQRNQNGVATTQTSRGGEAKTKNGKGVYKSPSGKTCMKTANNDGCN